MSTTKTILLAGYGWFAGIPEGETNNAELIARALDGETLVITCEDGKTVCGHIRSIVVPVVWETAFPQVKAAIEAIRPDLVLAIGTDARASALRPEPYAVNWQRGTDALPEDPSRQTTVDGKILPEGEDFLRGTLPYEAMVHEILAAGIPAQLGALLPPREDVPLCAAATPGMYLCNKMATCWPITDTGTACQRAFCMCRPSRSTLQGGGLRSLTGSAAKRSPRQWPSLWPLCRFR